jgi:hypothetical protein
MPLSTLGWIETALLMFGSWLCEGRASVRLAILAFAGSRRVAPELWRRKPRNQHAALPDHEVRVALTRARRISNGPGDQATLSALAGAAGIYAANNRRPAFELGETSRLASNPPGA